MKFIKSYIILVTLTVCCTAALQANDRPLLTGYGVLQLTSVAEGVSNRDIPKYACFDAKDRLWVAFQNGVDCYGEFPPGQPTIENKVKKLKSFRSTEIQYDDMGPLTGNANYMFLAIENYILRINLDTFKTKKIMLEGAYAEVDNTGATHVKGGLNVSSMDATEQYLWVKTRSHGIYRIDLKNFTMVNKKNLCGGAEGGIVANDDFAYIPGDSRSNFQQAYHPRLIKSGNFENIKVINSNYYTSASILNGFDKEFLNKNGCSYLKTAYGVLEARIVDRNTDLVAVFPNSDTVSYHMELEKKHYTVEFRPEEKIATIQGEYVVDMFAPSKNTDPKYAYVVATLHHLHFVSENGKIYKSFAWGREGGNSNIIKIAMDKSGHNLVVIVSEGRYRYIYHMKTFFLLS